MRSPTLWLDLLILNSFSQVTASYRRESFCSILPCARLINHFRLCLNYMLPQIILLHKVCDYERHRDSTNSEPTFIIIIIIKLLNFYLFSQLVTLVQDKFRGQIRKPHKDNETLCGQQNDLFLLASVKQHRNSGFHPDCSGIFNAKVTFEGKVVKLHGVTRHCFPQLGGFQISIEEFTQSR